MLLLSSFSKPISSWTLLPSSPITKNRPSTTALSSFYDSISKPKYIAAPMVSQSDLAFRLLVREYGVDLCYTQMIHAANFIGGGDKFRQAHLDVYPRNAMYPLAHQSQHNAVLGTNSIKEELLYDENGPIIVQIAGHDPKTMTEAALQILDYAQSNIAAIDINFGCPQDIARKGNYGAHLFTSECNRSSIQNLVSSLRNALPSDIGLTAKIRLLNDMPSTLSQIQSIVEYLDLLTVHGRTLTENKTKVKHADWDAIAAITQRFSLPIIANGGIEFSSDVSKCLEHTGADGVMSSEALLENPGIFAPDAVDDTSLSPRELFHRQITYASKYLEYATLYPPVPLTSGKMGGSFNVVRGHLFKMLYRYLEENHDLRDQLANHRYTISIAHAQSIVNQMVERYDSMSDYDLDQLGSSSKSSSWYRRHRNLNGRFVHVRDNRQEDNDAMKDPEAQKMEIRKRIEKLKKAKKEKSIISFG